MPNEEQAKAWTEVVGPVWLEREQDLDVVSRPFGLAAMDAARIGPGDKVVDVGCGTGSTTIDLARRVAPDGSVLGVDISPLLLARAKDKARGEDVTNLEFIEADAQTGQLPSGPYDVVFSRFGVMFFEDPVAAFANLRAATRSGGRLAFVCWRDVFSNAWMSMPTMGAASVLGAFELQPDGAPGPFAFADAEHVRTVVEGAGYTDVEVRPYETTMDTPVATVDEWLGFLLRMGPLGNAYMEADDTKREATMSAVVEAVGPYRSGDVYRLPAAAWIVGARAA